MNTTDAPVPDPDPDPVTEPVTDPSIHAPATDDEADLLTLVHGLAGRDTEGEQLPRFGVTADPNPQTFPSVRTSEQGDVIDRIGNPVPVDVDIVLPIRNEEKRLARRVRKLAHDLTGQEAERNGFTWNIVIADRGSEDASWEIAREMTKEFPRNVRSVKLASTGRGRALKLTWGESMARVVSYMDLNFSTDMKDIGFLVGSLLVGGADIAVGSRLMSESRVSRSLKREFISRTYNIMLHTYLDAHFHDAQCSLKALTSIAAARLIPLIKDNDLFFDTELLLQAQYHKMLIHEIPVTWSESADPDFVIADSVQNNLDGMRRMKKQFMTGVRASNWLLPMGASEAMLDLATIRVSTL